MKRFRPIVNTATSELPKPARERTRVLILDPHELVRRGLSMLVGSQTDLDVCGAIAVSAFDAGMLGTLRPDVVLLDVSGTGRAGIDLVKVIRATAPGIRIIALAVYRQPETIGSVMSAGASDFVLKTDIAERLLAAVRNQHGILAPPVVKRRTQKKGATSAPRQADKQLAPLEREIIALIAAGVPSATIAARLRVSLATVEACVRHIKVRLHVASAVALVRRCVALQRGRRRHSP